MGLFFQKNSEKEIEKSLGAKLPEQACCRCKDGVATVEGAYCSRGDWNRRLDPFTNSEKLLGALKGFHKEHPDIKIVIRPTDEAKFDTSGRLFVKQKSEDDLWYGRDGKFCQVSSEFLQIAEVEGLVREKEYASPVRKVEPNVQSPKASMNETLLGQIHKMNEETVDALFKNPWSNMPRSNSSSRDFEENRRMILEKSAEIEAKFQGFGK